MTAKEVKEKKPRKLKSKKEDIKEDINNTSSKECSKNKEYIGKKNLFIVESPAKIKKIQYFLGNDFVVKASVGHIRDLDKKKGNNLTPLERMGIDVDNDFKPHYINDPSKRKVITDLKKEMADTDLVWLAPDEDREGEGIAWHLKEVLKVNDSKIRRVTFNEITKNAVCKSLDNPRTIDMNLVNAQQSRRILDRLVGFELSPVLWKFFSGQKLSAGRVQSVVAKLIYERENEIKDFISENYFKIEGNIYRNNNDETVNKSISKSSKTSKTKKSKVELVDNVFNLDIVYNQNVYNSDIITQYFKIVQNNNLKVIDYKKGTENRNPAPPYTTSTLQQDASNKHSIGSKQTMEAAQKLYESGLITYMRTDSVALSDVALGMLKKEVIERFGEENYKFRKFNTKSKGAQEAHECIRPTHMDIHDVSMISDDKLIPKDGFTTNMRKIYKLIWKRTVGSQMVPAEYDTYDVKFNFDMDFSNVDVSDSGSGDVSDSGSGDVDDGVSTLSEVINSVNNNYTCKYRNLIKLGFLLVYQNNLKTKKKEDNGMEDENCLKEDNKDSKGNNEGDIDEEDENKDCLDKELIKFLESIKIGDIFSYKKIYAEEKQTNSKTRFNEANLVKTLENKQIGRPSTYAGIISVILDRGYVAKKTIPSYSKDTKIISMVNGVSEITNNEIKKKIPAERNKLVITDEGIKVVKFLQEHFPTIMDYKFTATMEENLDKIASGESNMKDVLKMFYSQFHPEVDTIMKSNISADNNKQKLGAGSKVNDRRHVGTDPDSGSNIYVLTARYGPVVQLGEKNALFAPILDKNLDMNDITVEEALDIIENRKKYLESKKNNEKTNGTKSAYKSGTKSGYKKWSKK